MSIIKRLRAYLSPAARAQRKLKAARKLVLRDVRQKLAEESSAARREHYRLGGTTTSTTAADRAYFEGVQKRNALTREIFRLIPL